MSILEIITIYLVMGFGVASHFVYVRGKPDLIVIGFLCVLAWPIFILAAWLG